VITGIGIDITELSRIRDLLVRNPKLANRILTENEKETYAVLTGRRQAEFLAGRFAAKEAFAKANGTGIGKNLSFQDIEIATDASGKPFIVRPAVRAHLSISHSREYAVAEVVIEAGQPPSSL
jgi:holo-[acyl-carrier protein] synthase